jgi:hypothetical protein
MPRSPLSEIEFDVMKLLTPAVTTTPASLLNAIRFVETVFPDELIRTPFVPFATPAELVALTPIRLFEMTVPVESVAATATPF